MTNPGQSSEFPLLEQTLAHARDYLASLADGPVAATASLPALRARFAAALQEGPVDPARVIDELVENTGDGLMRSTSGRFFAWVIGGSLPAALAADWLTSVWDQNAAIHACSPAEAVIEETCGAWLKDLLQLPATASFALTTGSQMAHTVALAAARHALLARAGWDVEEDGLWGAPPVRVLTSDQHHGSLQRALRVLGLGRRALVSLPADAQGRLAPATLQFALDSAPGVPTIVVLQAGDLNTGAYDDFATLVPMARARGAWVHVDGAFGLWAAASPRLRHLTAAAGTADSWVADGHKWLNVPYDCGYAFVADPAAHFASMSHRESYLLQVDGARDALDWNPEWSRRGRSVATYAALRQLGRQGVAGLLERTSALAGALVDGIGALDGAEVVWRSEVNQGLVRFPAPVAGAQAADHERHTDAVIAAVAAGGEAYFGGTTWRGQRCMRISVCNWRTTPDDVTRTVAAVRDALARVSEGGR
ncbi:pyridoxal phosphate-dependent decarboxylase family protein [Cupriavidus sp. 30B13]|uniref:pyridoxal phosphate-dependent decarboxylase family protein n=1 Tax=Cupriavidus sp. 30B13 TaxID=3384241 RepID=UPI003B8FAF64